MNHASDAVAPPHAEVVQAGDAIWQRARARSPRCRKSGSVRMAKPATWIRVVAVTMKVVGRGGPRSGIRQLEQRLFVQVSVPVAAGPGGQPEPACCPSGLGANNRHIRCDRRAPRWSTGRYAG
jgi:hypothetical protein